MENGNEEQKQMDSFIKGAFNLFNLIVLFLMAIFCIAIEEDAGLIVVGIFGAIAVVVNFISMIYFFIKKRSTIHILNLKWFFVTLIAIPIFGVVWFLSHFTKIGG